jgi:bifunctional DNA-binding transcriptional regulator/antitoxin component of YhaV-PrlF toxin-antitoxin module
MKTSTLTDKGQTTVPEEIREALNMKPRQKLTWVIQDDGSAIVRPQPSALALFGSMRSRKKFTSRQHERTATIKAVGRHAATEGLQ